ncbi:MAG: hypothetical protein IJD79_04470 [Clostridia bacterium]|nr:hypothetical protein [Clostridia bacterium]
MKKTIATILILISLVLSFTGCINTTALPKEMPDDFTFYVSWGDSNSYYDSATGELRKRSGDKFVTTYIMTEDELEVIYNIIREMKIESFDDILSYSDVQGLYGCSPCMTVSISVKAGEVDRTVTAEKIPGFSAGLTRKGKRYLEAVKEIVDILEATEEWKSLPPDPSGGN